VDNIYELIVISSDNSTRGGISLELTDSDGVFFEVSGFSFTEQLENWIADNADVLNGQRIGLGEDSTGIFNQVTYIQFLDDRSGNLVIPIGSGFNGLIIEGNERVFTGNITLNARDIIIRDLEVSGFLTLASGARSFSGLNLEVGSFNTLISQPLAANKINLTNFVAGNGNNLGAGNFVFDNAEFGNATITAINTFEDVTFVGTLLIEEDSTFDSVVVNGSVTADADLVAHNSTLATGPGASATMEIANGKTVTLSGISTLGTVDNDENENEALKKLLIENEWIIDAEFNVAEFICYEIS
jgi:hypothetical protein